MPKPNLFGLTILAGALSATVAAAYAGERYVYRSKAAVIAAIEADVPAPYLSLAKGSLPEATVGQPWSYEFSALLTTQNVPDGGVSWSGVSLPGWMTVSPTTGRASGTPDEAGEHGFDVSAVLGSVGSRETFRITVSGVTLEVVQVATGSLHTCALTSEGAVKCWGNNAFGQLGDGTRTSRSTPPETPIIASGISAIVAGHSHTCALTVDGAFTCWGNNEFGQLGDASTVDRLVPPSPKLHGEGFASLAAGYYHTCALSSGGQTACWGRNDGGQLGDGSNLARSIPTEISVDPRPIAIDAGFLHTCALTSVGSVKCWGSNSEGQLGNGSRLQASRPPTDAAIRSGIKAISSGAYHTCALDTAGTLKCWGRNTLGQLGDGTTSMRDVPTAVATGVTKIEANNSTTCVLGGSGDLRCWGSNAFGQHGNGTTTTSFAPPPTSPVSFPVALLSLGGTHLCATGTDRELRCWGNNSNGQLGDGTTRNLSTPPNDGISVIGD